jgi:hypothetical protein
MAKRKKDAISKRPDEATVAKKKPARFKATVEEARKRTVSVKKMFQTIGKLWWELGAEVKACIDDFVPEALGQKATEWMKDCFGDTWLKVYRAHRAVAALPAVPKAKLEKISEGNAYQLARLPKQVRQKSEWIEKAIKLPNEEFKHVVDSHREKKGEKRDPMVKWKDIFRISSVPKTLAKVMENALELAGKNGDFDLDSKEGRINAIEMIFAEFLTSQAQPTDEIILEKQIETEQEEIVPKVNFLGESLEQTFDPTSDIPGEPTFERDTASLESFASEEEAPKSKRRRKATAA